MDVMCVVCNPRLFNTNKISSLLCLSFTFTAFMIFFLWRKALELSGKYITEIENVMTFANVHGRLLCLVAL